VEQSCYKCGAKFEEGAAFCPQCNAPQIRVASGENLELVAPSESAPPIYYSTARSPGRIEWLEALPAAALADVLAAVATLFLPLGLAVLAAGFLAVVFYRRRRPLAQLGPGIGALLGTLSGTLGFGFLAVCLAIAAAMSHSWEQVRHQVMEPVRQAASRNPDPQTQQVLELFSTPAGFVVFLVMLLLMFLLVAGVGGAIGGAILRRRKPPEIGRF